MRARGTRDSNLAVRIITAAIGIPAVLLVNAAGGWVFAGVVGAAAIVGEWEAVRLLRSGRHRPAVLLCVPAATALAVMPAARHAPFDVWIGIIVALVALAGVYYLHPAVYDTGLVNWALTCAAAIYVGLFLGYLTLLREAHQGARWIVLVLLMTWAYDTGAYFAGRYRGRRGFMRHVSSKKTREGVLGGLALATAAGLLAIPLVNIMPWQAPVLGLLTGIVAQAGDLVESMIKRQTGVKDSGGIVPGHGGLLDRIDSLLLTGVLGYYAALVLGYAS